VLQEKIGLRDSFKMDGEKKGAMISTIEIIALEGGWD
jgi:hypothetical protein